MNNALRRLRNRRAGGLQDADTPTPADLLPACHGWVLAHPTRSLALPKDRAQLAPLRSPALSAPLDAAAASALVDVHLFHVDPQFPRAHRHRALGWQDMLELRRDDRRWTAHDVRYVRGGSLQATLQVYVSIGAGHCARH